MTKNIRIIVVLCAIMVGVHLINTLIFGLQLNQFGILPRHISSLPGIVFSPFLHGSLLHLLGNLISFSIFSFLILLKGQRYYTVSSVIIILLGGLGVWLAGRGNYHVGASGWIFGLWALCIADAWYTRSIKNILIAFVVIVFWGGMIFGLLPKNPYVSFEAHIFGAIAGVVAAAVGRNLRKR